MDREVKIANAVYIAFVAILTAAMLGGSYLLSNAPQNFFV